MMAATTTTSSPQCSNSHHSYGATGGDSGVALAWNTSSGFGYGFGGGYNNFWDTSAAGASVDQMDSLFDDDWLHENNLDILFDLFEEEIESSSSSSSSSTGSSCNYSFGGHKFNCFDTSYTTQLNSHANNTATTTTSSNGNTNGSSNILGSSPITSYLFGTSPSLASALDLYDLLYFDNQQQQQQQPSSQTNEMSCTNHHHNCSNNTSTTCHTTGCINHSRNSCNIQHVNQTTTSSSNQTQKLVACKNQQNPNRAATNSMRIKRKVKKRQSEGISLLAKPISTSKSNSNIINTTNNNYIHKNNVVKHSKSHNDIHSSNNNHHVRSSSSINKNKSDKTSTKITNFMNTIIGNHSSTNTVNIKSIMNSNISATNNTTSSNSVSTNKDTTKKNSSNSSSSNSSSNDKLCNDKKDKDSSLKSHQTQDRFIHSFHHHVHYITGCSIVREHAYAVQGH